MTRTGVQRRLLICFLVVSSMLGLYTLCVSLEIQVPWRMMALARFSGTHRVQQQSSNYSQGTTTLPHPTHVLKLSTEPNHQHSSSAVITALKAQATRNGALPRQENNTTSSRRPSPRITTRSLQLTIKDPPFIGDSYAREEAPPQTECADGIRSRVSQTEFGERFLVNIPVLQWAKHATQDQYERLQQYPGTHGWKGLSFHTVLASLSVLNTEANRQMLDDWARRANGSRSRCMRCAVVGNGGIMNGSKRGREIDQHEYVFRTNGAITKGFEEDVGTRTTHYTFSTNTMRNSMASYGGQGYHGPPQSEETRYVFLPDQDRDYLLLKAAAMNTTVERGPEMNQKASVYFGKTVSVHNIKMYHPDFVRYIRNRFLRSHTLTTKYKDIYRPSTGAVMLLAAMHTCDKVSAYGFMTPDYSRYSDHYFNKQYKPVGFYINHDLRMELNLWQQLHKAGLLQLYMRP
ncbi:alpha-N-acetylgalactosaminide alpha-2,6-sialyltransferase 2 [Hypomesus transpacificus]|uniref:alpha-N-acetylgalactosaminide alpha-2,6-sialyltransferase 2 n=1 Tax=Hypomesus transpacificus TaxID=137520 RepID=UPI001F077F1A|nr:alpha-N-acetylgalactosaminide alpha-2,6-sialyltransferase 2 [Hypomesus transpacificus]